jgi:hypothetical protein
MWLCGQDPHNVYPDPDPAFHFNADPDPDNAPHQSDGNLRPLDYRPSRAPVLSLQASIVSVLGLHGSILSR